MQKVMLLKNTEASIGEGGLKALFTGIDIGSKPWIAAQLEAAFDLNPAKLPNHYSYERYCEMLEWLRLQLYPGLSAPKAYEQIGRSIIKGFFQGRVGQVLKLTVNVLGAQRSMRYFFRIAVNALEFGRFEIIEEKPGYVRAILYNVPGTSEIMCGMGLESMAHTNAKNGTVTYRRLNNLDTEYTASWQE